MFSILLYCFIILTDNILATVPKLPFDTIVGFGDDNTDTGNVYTLTNHQWPLVPPYYLGRFTNGPVWIEQLGINTIMNYAYIGATIDNNNLVAGFTQPNKTIVPGVRQQIQIYLTNNDIATIHLARTLYVIWIGTNDYLDNSSLTADLVVNSLIDAVYDLVLVGIKNLLIINQPPLEAYPFYKNSTGNLTLGTLIDQHNNYLSSNISQIISTSTKISINIFDLHSLIANILSNNLILTLNKIDNCWTILNNNTVLQCTNPANYVFIDDYHLTTSIHQFIANNIHQFLLASSSCYYSLSKLFIFMYIIIFIIKEK